MFPRLFFLSLLCLSPLAADADVYGFVDESGATHLAREKLDERYKLFLKGEVGPQFNLLSELKALPEPGRVEDPGLFKRLQATPNFLKFETLVLKEARRQQLEPALVKAVIAVESGYDPAAISPRGATGLMQLIPDTAARYGVREIADPQDNVRGGTRYLRDLLDMFDGNLTLALAGFNAGEGAVRRYRNTVPPYPETQSYVKLVMQFYEYFGGGARKATPATQLTSSRRDLRLRLVLPPPRQGTRAEAPAVRAEAQP